jgi:hypothetical protein
MHTSLKITKTLLYYYSALHVSGTLAPIIRSLLILHIQPPFTVCRWVGCVFQLWSVTTEKNVIGSSSSSVPGAFALERCPGCTVAYEAYCATLIPPPP